MGNNHKAEPNPSPALMQQVLDNVPAAICWSDAGWRLLGCNRQYKQLFGDGECRPVEVVHTPDEDWAEDEKRALGGPGQGVPTVRRMPDGHGGSRWLRTARVPVYDETGAISLRLSITEDITGEMQLETMKKTRTAAISRKARKAMDQSRAKSDFLSQISHELRAPLNTIIGVLQMVADMPDQELVRHYLRQIEPAAKSLLGIINDVLDISKIEADKVEIRREAFWLEDMLRELYGAVGGHAQLKDIHLDTVIDPAIPPQLWGDARHIGLILSNLLSNALKFTPPGGRVVLHAALCRHSQDEVQVRFAVADTGIGLSADECRHLFLPFEQAGEEVGKKYGGSGLGLNIAQRVAHLMHSTIRVNSRAGHGSEFSFVLWLGAGQPAPKAQALAGARVLVVGEGSGGIPAFTRRLAAAGAAVQVARGVRQLDALLAQGGVPHAAVVDFALSARDELEVLRRVCRRVPPGRVLFLTSGPSVAQKQQQAAALGVGRVYARPFVVQDLLRGVQRLAGMEAADGGKAPLPSYRGRKLLLAEDVALNRDIIRHFLHKTGIALAEAENGEEAVQLYRAAPASYDMILMDVKMPGMDGVDAAIAIRAFEAQHGGRVPIVALTASVFEDDRRRCRAAGMDSVLTKPLDKEVLLAELGRYLPQAAEAPVQAEAEAPPPPPKDEPRSQEGEDSHPLIDVDGGLERVMNDRPFYLGLLRDFLQTDDLAAIQAAWQANDYAVLMARLHSLKGVAGNYGLARLQHCTRQLEATLFATGPAGEDYYRLLACFADTRRAIEALAAQG